MALFQFKNPENEFPPEDEVILARVANGDNQILHAMIYWKGHEFYDAVGDLFTFHKEDIVGWMPIEQLNELEIEMKR